MKCRVDCGRECKKDSLGILESISSEAALSREEKVSCDLKCESTLHSQSVDMLDSDVLSVGPLVSHRDRCNLWLYRIYSHTHINRRTCLFNVYMIHQPGFCLNPT